MKDMTGGERWNTLNSAEMALGIRRVLDNVMRQEEPPSECKVFLDKGIEFFEEAEAGGALIAGTPLEQAGSFKGTFSPLCLATDVYITFRNAPEGKGGFKEVSDLLNSYKGSLRRIRETGIQCQIGNEQLAEMGSFFGVLFDLLARQADPVTKGYSQPFTFVQG